MERRLDLCYDAHYIPRFFYSAQNEDLTIMTAYDIHEGINKYFQSIITANLLRMGIIEDHMCSVKFDTNGHLECGGVCHVPDLMLTINNVSNVQLDQCIFPIWLLETAFSQDGAQAIEKAIVMTDVNPSIKLFILVDIEERTSSSNNSSQPSHVAIATEPQLSAPEFRSLCRDSTPFGPIVVKGVEWMNVRKIAFKMFLRNEQGIFDFESQNNMYTASGEVERHIAIGILEVINAVIQVKLDAGVPSNDPDI
ncbi:hypothetical protein JVT61DRAFT_3908 [Boletus reticuloceps]|uniref:Uncharacterized protein n=1 Tax=Boletus reticuloceps TaxID=495285 RepID=A0A8I2YKY9_9AGAM|nr:hypothetical protein JVT61DRAFT_3908 [Boletus reticuloceps]